MVARDEALEMGSQDTRNGTPLSVVGVERLHRGCMRGAQVVSLREVVRLRRVDGICQNGSFVRGKMLWQGF